MTIPGHGFTSDPWRYTIPRKTLSDRRAQVLALAEKGFAEYTKDFAFTNTRVVIKLFTLGTRFISRSEARRVVANLEKWRSVVLDFAGVEEIGQGFADEVFRVWAHAHPDIKLEAVSMSAPVAFLVNRSALNMS